MTSTTTATTPLECDLPLFRRPQGTEPSGRLPGRDGTDRCRPLPSTDRTALPRALVAAIGVGVAFGAGLVIGGIGRAEASPPRSARVVDVDEDPVARAEARTQAYETLVKTTQLRWHRELVEPEPPPPPAPKVATSTPKIAKHLIEAATASPLIERPLVAPEPEPLPSAPALEADIAASDDDDVVVRPDPRQLDAALARVLGEKKPTPALSDKRYAVQLASTGTEAAARILAAQWQQRGHPTSVVAADVAGKGTMYRVRIGGIASRAAADALKLKLGQGLVVAD